MSCRQSSRRCLKDHPDRQRGPVPDRVAEARCARATPAAGGGPSQLVDGRQDFGRFGDPDEQGARADRGALSVRPAVGADRHRRPSAIDHPFDGRICRRLGARPARQSRTCGSRSLMRWPGRSGWRRRPSGSTLPPIGRLDFEAPDVERFPALAAGARGAGRGRGGAGRPQCRQRDRGRRFPRRRDCASRDIARLVERRARRANRRAAPRSIDDVSRSTG